MNPLWALLVLVALALFLLLYLKVSGDIKIWKMEKQRKALQVKLEELESLDEKASSSFHEHIKEYEDLKRRHAAIVAELELRKP